MPAALSYQEVRPSGPLGEAVECFWLLEGDPSGGGPAEPIPPDGRCELVINAAAPFRRHRAGGGCELQPARLLVGQADRPIEVEPTGRIDVLGVRFRPAGARALLGPPMRELRNAAVPLSDVCARLDRDVEAAVGRAGAPRARMAALEQVLARRLRGSRRDRRLEAVVAALLERRGGVPVGVLASSVGLSPRQLERLFHDEVGLGPKTFARVIRFQAVFRALESEGGSWAGAAGACGYADQAHLIRDFKQFAGRTPRALLALQARLTEVFTRGGAASDSYKTARPSAR